jgi:large subunit ribosomal protein L1
MDTKQLEDNLVSLLKDIDTVRPKRSGKFITRVLLKSPPSSEQLKIDPFLIIPEEFKKSGSGKREAQTVEDDDDEDVKEAVSQ